MFPPLPLEHTLKSGAIVSVAAIASLRIFLPDWSRLLPVRIGLALLLATEALGFTLWSQAPAFNRWDISSKGVGLTYFAITLLATLSVTVPPTAIIRKLLSLLFLRKPALPVLALPAPPLDVTVTVPVTVTDLAPATTSKLASTLSRRTLIHGTAASLPLLAMSRTARGFSTANDPQQLKIVRMRYPNLPPRLHGLRILHLSDLHLGVSFHVSDLEALLERARAHAPHLIVLTGDVIDDPSELAPALQAVHDFRAPLGAFASIGNHEYLHDIAVTRPIYDRSPVPLLLDRGATIKLGDARIWIAGANDPIREHDLGGFLASSVERCIAHAPADAFKLLLSHRPEGFLPGAARGFDLTLSGHTHGHQIGIGGKSILEVVDGKDLQWGSYTRGDKQLYTTSGFGHWFPFRVGCPTEAPIVILERGPSPAPSSTRARVG
jgi:predicted MPP superfamily phosphohydrolase